MTFVSTHSAIGIKAISALTDKPFLVNGVRLVALHPTIDGLDGFDSLEVLELSGRMISIIYQTVNLRQLAMFPSVKTGAITKLMKPSFRLTIRLTETAKLSDEKNNDTIQ